MTSKDTLSSWFDRGVAQNATHMIVVCDTFDYDDYPVYVTSDQDVRVEEAYYKKASMQRVMEVYNLKMDKQVQMSAHRAFNY